MKLTTGVKTNKELADWFGISQSTYKNSKQKHLEQLSNFCEYELTNSGKVNITKVIIDTYNREIAKQSNFSLIKDSIDEVWNKNGLDTAKNVSEKLMEQKDLTICAGTAYRYTLEGRNVLYGKPFAGKGEIGTCIYLWGVDNEDGTFRELTREEEAKKRQLLTKYFGDATEKQLLVRAMIESGEIKKEDAFELLEDMTNMKGLNFFAFLTELQNEIGCKVRRITKVERALGGFPANKELTMA